MPLRAKDRRWQNSFFWKIPVTFQDGFCSVRCYCTPLVTSWLSLPHNLGGSSWLMNAWYSYNIILPYYVVKSVDFVSALWWVPQKPSLALELGPEAQGGKGSTRMLMICFAYPQPVAGGGRRVPPQRREEQSHCSLHLGPCIFLHTVCCWGLRSKRWALLTLPPFLGELFAVLVSMLAGDYAGRENKQLCHPSVHTNTLPGADCTVGKMTPKLCVMSRKRLETALAMLKIDISGGGKKKKRGEKTPSLY